MLDAAEHMFRTRSLDAIRIEDIAEAADVSVGSFYVHFGSKDGVIQAVTQRIAERATAYLAEAFTSDAGPLEKIGAAGTAYMRFLIDNPALVRYLGTDLAGEGDGQIETILVDRIGALTDLFTAAIQEAIDAGESRPVDARLMALFLFGAWNGVASLALRAGPPELSPEQLEACLEQARNVVLAGLTPPTNEGSR